MDHIAVQVIMRWLHIVSAMVIVGGATFFIACGLRAVRPLDDALRSDVLKNMQARFLRLMMLAILGLLISGIYSWILSAAAYREMGPAANALIGTKVLFAAILFVIVFAQSSKLLPERNPRFWPMFYLHLGLVIVLLGSILRCLRLAHH